MLTYLKTCFSQAIRQKNCQLTYFIFTFSIFENGTRLGLQAHLLSYLGFRSATTYVLAPCKSKNLIKNNFISLIRYTNSNCQRKSDAGEYTHIIQCSPVNPRFVQSRL